MQHATKKAPQQHATGIADRQSRRGGKVGKVGVAVDTDLTHTHTRKIVAIK